jgi:hypothetical protein
MFDTRYTESARRDTPTDGQWYDRLPELSDFPIPAEPRINHTWSPSLVEMANHVGPHAALTISDRFGGRLAYFAMDCQRSPFTRLVGEEKARILCAVYGREYVTIPTALAPLSQARRGALFAMVRAGHLSIRRAASIMRVRRHYFSRLLKDTDEGIGIEPGELPLPQAVRLVTAAAAIAAAALQEAGIPPGRIDRMAASIMALAD